MSYTNSIHSRELVRTSKGYPVKLYNFTRALEEGIFLDKKQTREYLLNILECYPEISQGFEYSIAFAWGYILGDDTCSCLRGKKVKALDVVSYKFDKPWNECNPDVSGWVFRDLNYNPDDKDILCETATIILGKEAELRRTTSDKNEFLNKWPNIGELCPLV